MSKINILANKKIIWLIINIFIFLIGLIYGQIPFTYLMTLITFPSGIIFLFSISIFNIDTVLYNNELIVLILEWLMLLFIGYLQWFIIIPKIKIYFLKKNKKV